MSKFKNWLSSTKMLIGLRAKPILRPRKFFKVSKDFKPQYAPELDHLIPIADAKE